MPHRRLMLRAGGALREALMLRCDAFLRQSGRSNRFCPVSYWPNLNRFFFSPHPLYFSGVRSGVCTPDHTPLSRGVSNYGGFLLNESDANFFMKPPSYWLATCMQQMSLAHPIVAPSFRRSHAAEQQLHERHVGVERTARACVSSGLQEGVALLRPSSMYRWLVSQVTVPTRRTLIEPQMRSAFRAPYVMCVAATDAPMIGETDATSYGR